MFIHEESGFGGDGIFISENNLVLDYSVFLTFCLIMRNFVKFTREVTGLDGILMYR